MMRPEAAPLLTSGELSPGAAVAGAVARPAEADRAMAAASSFTFMSFPRVDQLLVSRLGRQAWAGRREVYYTRQFGHRRGALVFRRGPNVAAT